MKFSIPIRPWISSARSVVWLVAILVTGFISWAAREETSPYRVQGYIRQSVIRYMEPAGFYYELKTNSFDLYVDACRWMVTLDEQNKDLCDYRVASSDGENTYLLLAYLTRTAKIDPNNTNHVRNLGDLNIMTGNVPRSSFAEEAGAIWLALASGCHFLTDSSSLRPVPFCNYVRSSPVLHGEPLVMQKAIWKTHSAAPFLPRNIDYMIEDLSGAGLDGAEHLLKGNKFTNVTLRTKNFVQIGSYSFPELSTVSIYRILRKGDQSMLQLCQEFDVVQTNVTLGASPSFFKPVLPGKTFVSEHRFNDGSGVNFSYFATNAIPGKETVRRTEEYRAALALPQKPQSGTRKYTVWIIAIALAVPAIWAFVIWKKSGTV